MVIYKSSSFRIVSFAILLFVTVLGFSLQGSAEEKNSYNFSSPRKALASYISNCEIIEDYLILREDRIGDG